MALSYEPLTSARAIQFKESMVGAFHLDLVKVSPSDCVLPVQYLDIAQRVLDFQVRPDDVWLVTFPKCGTTWSQELVWLLMNDLDYERASSKMLPERFPFIEFSSTLPIVRKFGPHSIEKCEQMKSPRLIKSHLPLELLPKQLWTVKPKIIYVVRNVKDVIVSYYHDYKLWSDTTLTLDEFAEFFMENIPSYAPFWRHVLDFWDMRNESNVMFYCYEDMQTYLETVIQNVANFLGKSVPADQLPKLKEHLSVEKMRANPSVNYDQFVEMVRKDAGLVPAASLGKSFIRSGRLGGSLTSFSEDMRLKIDDWTEESLADSDYTGPS